MTDETIYIYSNDDGSQVDSFIGQDNDACENWAEHVYGSDDYHWSYADVLCSNVI